MIDHQATKMFTWFVEQVTEAWRTGGVNKSKALLAEVFKLLGNSGYGKFIAVLERQMCVIYAKDEKLKLGQAYDLESGKTGITINLPFQNRNYCVSAEKLRILEFYSDFFDWYFEHRDLELIQMDAAISADWFEDIVRPELRAEFEARKQQWLAWYKWSGRTPGLLKAG